MSKQIYFHEDDYCQVELLPAGAREFAAKQLAAIHNFAEEHRAENGAGFADIFVRKASPATTAEMKLSAARVAVALAEVGNTYDEVYTGYGSYKEICRNTKAYGTAGGTEGESIVCFDEKDGAVTNIWLLFEPDSDEFAGATTELLKAFHAFGEFILVDWSWGALLDIQDQGALLKYLNELLEAYR